MKYYRTIKSIETLINQSDYYDVKTVEGEKSMANFIACMLYYSPEWLKSLYRLRRILAKILGLKHDEFIQSSAKQPKEVTFTPGETALFFTVTEARTNEYWISHSEDKYLSAYFAIVQETLTEKRKRFHVITIVNFNHWTGPVYFTIIKPFHHLVVQQMANAGIQS